MKLKTSLTLSEDLVVTLDKMAGAEVSRSALIEKILRDFVDGRTQARRDFRKTAAIARQAARLNAEMKDVLDQPKRAIALQSLKAVTEGTPKQPESARKFMRRMRDDARY